MKIRYKKVAALYAVLLLTALLFLRHTVVRPAVSMVETVSLRRKVERMEKDLKEPRTDVSITEHQDPDVELQKILLSVLGCLDEAGCTTLSGTPSRRKSPDACPIFDVSVAFSGSFREMLSALASIDSLLEKCSTDACVTSCRIGAERSADGREWALVCHETIQCLPALEVIPPEEAGRNSYAFGMSCGSPFLIPQIRARGRKDDAGTVQRVTRAGTGRSAPQGRMIGRIGSGPLSIVIVEIGGECRRLHRGDGVLLRDYGDSVKVVIGKTDTLMLRRK